MTDKYEEENEVSKEVARAEIAILTSEYLKKSTITIIPFGIGKGAQSKMEKDSYRVRNNMIRKLAASRG